MSKYNKLWEYINLKKEKQIILTFNEIKNILGFNIDHSFLNYKKEVIDYDIKTSLKNKNVTFIKK